MARKHYKNESLMKILTILGALVGIATIILTFASIDAYPIFPGLSGEGIYQIIILIVGLVICVLTLLAGIRPGDPIPFHWLILFILGILLVVFGAGIWACALVIIAALIGLIDDL
ncbi:MAG: hypothetical protein GF317_25070 [Candidatus Lokiarchaeota archaeon]|nr:hypothetical protein [Candidatus Lokiarchaeota archaeon]MBD3202631.1 hypothetical protein [Candidatus Lokiarchaeota archaeon]